MQPSNRFNLLLNAGIALLYVILSIQFVGLVDPWLSIICGIAIATVIVDHHIHDKSFIFLLVSGLSCLENAPWFMDSNTLIVSLIGLSGTLIFHFFRSLRKHVLFIRIIQAAPIVLVIFLMPIPSSFSAKRDATVAILDGGVWATIKKLPEAEAALSIKHQYTYEIFQESLGAKIISANETLDGIDKLVIITPTIPFSRIQIESIHDWTKRGGRLVIIADHTNLFGHQTVLKDLAADFGIELRPDAVFETETNGGIYGNFFSRYTGLTPCSISKGVIPRLKMKGWSEYPDYEASSFFGELEISNDDHYGSYPVLGSRRSGLGEVTVFTDSTFFANFGINRWSSQSLLNSIFWSPKSSIIAVIGLILVMGYLFKPYRLILLSGVALVIISPNIGFSDNSAPSARHIVNLKPPNSFDNDTEERDRGQGSALLASAYAFDVGIKWENSASFNLRETLYKEGLQLPYPKKNASVFTDLPPFDIQKIADGKFYLDQSSFWFGGGAGAIRTANMRSFWRFLGADLDSEAVSLAPIDRVELNLLSSDGQMGLVEIVKLPKNWTVINQRIVAKWIPKSSKWLARKEWQLGPWLEKDLVFEVAPITK